MDNNVGVGDGGFWHAIKTFWTWLPTITGAIGGFFGMIATTIQLYESRTFQHWKNNWLLRHRARKLMRLKKRAKITAARIQALERIKTARTEAREIISDAKAEAAGITVESAVAHIIEHPSSAL